MYNVNTERETERIETKGKERSQTQKYNFLEKSNIKLMKCYSLFSNFSLTQRNEENTRQREREKLPKFQQCFINCNFFKGKKIYTMNQKCTVVLLHVLNLKTVLFTSFCCGVFDNVIG